MFALRLPSLAFATLLLVGCDEDDPFAIPWEAEPLESVIYTLDREPEGVVRPNGFNLLERSGVAIEDPAALGQWDFALERTQGGDGLVLLPPRVLGVVSRAAIVAIPGVGYDDVRTAPADTLLYTTDAPVPVEIGSVYVIRTHEQPGFLGQFCSFYGKIAPLEIDLVQGTLRFLHDVNPDCSSRSLIPPG